MKFATAQIAYFLQNKEARRNIRLLWWLAIVLVGLVVTYSVLFHFLMEREDQKHSWATGFYWTLTVMTTLGFGDITFSSDVGRIFSIIVLLSGVMFLLVVLPFAFIQFFLAPWIEAQSQARAPRKLPREMRNHVLISHYNPVAASLTEKLLQHHYNYAVIVQDLKYALELHDLGVRVVVGDLDDPETYRRCRLDQAVMVVASGGDMVNTSMSLTVREVSDTVPIVANAEHEDSVDVLRLVEVTHVLQMKSMLGGFLARRAIGMSSRVNHIGRFGDLVIAEASATRSPIVGKTIAETQLRETTGVTVIGIWERGKFELARADSKITSASVLVLAGTETQLQAYDELFCIYIVSDAPVMILGGGRVGCAVAAALDQREIDYRIVEQDPKIATSPKHVLGSAADLDTLKKAGLETALTAIVTTSDDDANIYLTVYCRRLCPDMQIICRANLERNISTLHRAGADFVMSYASMGSSAIMNILLGEDLLLFAEGLNVFRVHVPPMLVGKKLAESRIREDTGCSVIGIEAKGHVTLNPSADTILAQTDELVLIGDAAGQNRMLELLP